MRTELTEDPKVAAEFIKAGGIAAFPTETVYGLGADVFNEAAVAKIFEAKQRPADNPLIAHISNFDQVRELAAEITKYAEELIKRFFPGPLTVILKKNERVPEIATAGLDSVGIRMPRNSLAREFLRACGVPVSAPSANISGRPSPTTWQAVFEDLDGRIDCILRGEPTEIGLESTVVDCRGDFPVVLRKGAVSLDELRSLVPETQLYSIETAEIVPSPGLRHKHYSPAAKIVLVRNPDEIETDVNQAYIGLANAPLGMSYSKVVRNVEEYAHLLFEFFRECDRRGIETICCQETERNGIGSALMDRIERAANED